MWLFFIYLCLACLQKISDKFKLSEGASGFLLAIGCSIPEMSTSILSCFTGKAELIGYAFG